VQRPALEHTVDGLDGYKEQCRAATVDQRTEAMMSIPLQLSSYLEQRGVHYEVFAHRPSRTSVHTARTANVAPHDLAKSVIVEDDAGCVMAVVTADRKVKLGELSRMLGRRHLRLADEQRIAELFTDCERGAVPALGMAWNVETVVNGELETSTTVYIEGGDHERLPRLSHDQFHALMATAGTGNSAPSSPIDGHCRTTQPPA
jgi:Ala-tRNA(Pro) deacylase